MEVRNLNSTIDGWTTPISNICNEYPSNMTVLGKTFPIQKPSSVFLVTIETMNEIGSLTNIRVPSNYFLPFQDLKNLSRKSEGELEQLLVSCGSLENQSGQPGCMVWAHYWLIEYLRENFNVRVEPKAPLVFLSPEAIANRFSYVRDYFSRVLRTQVDFNQLNERIVGIVALHELGHVCFERLGKPSESRLSEGLTNFIVYHFMDKLGKQVLNALACSPELDFRRNYYQLMRMYGSALDQIIVSYLEGNRGLAFDIFSQMMRSSEALNTIENMGGKLRFGGPIEGNVWVGYGSNRKNISCATAIPFLCNVKSGIVIAHRIDRMVGFFSEELKIITNEIGAHDFPTNALPDNIRIVGVDELDIPRVVKEEIITEIRTEEEVIRPFFQS